MTLVLDLTPRQTAMVRELRDQNDRVARIVPFSRRTESERMLVPVTNKTRARQTCTALRALREQAASGKRTGPSVKMQYALDRHIAKVREQFDV